MTEREGKAERGERAFRCWFIPQVARRDAAELGIPSSSSKRGAGPQVLELSIPCCLSRCINKVLNQTPSNKNLKRSSSSSCCTTMLEPLIGWYCYGNKNQESCSWSLFLFLYCCIFVTGANEKRRWLRESTHTHTDLLPTSFKKFFCLFFKFFFLNLWFHDTVP